MSNPFIYPVSATQFGFIYHPLYQLFGGDVAAIRQTNFLITFCLSWALGDIFLKTVFAGQPLTRIYRIVISSAIAATAAASLVHQDLWLATPSYNRLALQSLLIVAIGLFLFEKSFSGLFLIGAGGWLAFMAKPTTAAAIAVVMIFYLWFARKLKTSSLVTPILIALSFIILSALIIDGSIFTFVNRLKAGAEMYKILQAGGHGSLFRLDFFYFSLGSLFFIFGCTVAFFLSAYYSQSIKTHWVIFAASLSILIELSCLSILIETTQETIFPDRFQGLYIGSIPIATLIVGYIFYRKKGPFKMSQPHWALALTFFIFPFVYAFGTGNNYWASAASAGIFWVFSGLVFLVPLAPHLKLSPLLLSLGLSVQLISVVQVHNGFQKPYRQTQPLHLNDQRVTFGKPGSTLVLSKDFANYIQAAVKVSRQAGFIQATPMIDLTGKSPGILYAIGAKNIGQPWTVGGYPGSEALAIMMLKKLSCKELATAWLLIEPEGPRKVSPNILQSFGANLSTDFEIVGIINTAKGAGGFKEVYVQKFFKPIRSTQNASEACSAKRTSRT